MLKYRVKELLDKGKEANLQEVCVQGWVRSFRSNRFIALNDGSSLNNIQIVVDFEKFNQELLKKITTASAIKVIGEVVESQGKGQEIEIIAKEIEILGEANPDDIQSTILQPKRHSLETLREQAHLRFRTNTFSAIMRVRNSIMFGIHKFFNERGFVYVNTPIITGSDAEGAGEMFTITNFDLNKDLPKTEDGTTDFSKDFFGKHTNLTVSGQLEAEAAAMGLGKVYTFGPTFRAENSNTTRHLAEFWMVEPEMAFYDLEDNMNIAEEFINYIINYIIQTCEQDLAFLEKRLIQEESKKHKRDRSLMSLTEKLEFVTANPFIRISYTEAIEILKDSKPNKNKQFKYPIEEWGVDLQSEHERYLVEKHFQCPVIVYDYPSKIKAFYMRENEDGKTVRAMDILFPGIGEIAGGSQREERYDVLKEKMQEFDIDHKELSWYLDTRKFGTCVHSGFGLGFERLVQFATGMGNIRDVIPYPRTPGHAEY